MAEDSGVWADDYMGRKTSAEFLTRYLLANNHVRVLNVNSAWGAGKTFFLERWAKELSEEHVCVCFNAWESDYSSEPLIALMAALEQQLVDSTSLGYTEAGKSVVKTTSDLIKKSVPLIARGLLMKAVGVDFNDLIGAGGEEAAGKMIEDLVAEQSNSAQKVEDFKKALKEGFVQAAENKNKKAPVFIFIDELDRCRPTYAIELLERIKHFFDLDDCKFVIASDSVQLAHSIKVVYGQDFSSEGYLKRFFDAEFSLDNRNIMQFVHSILPLIDSYPVGVRVNGARVIYAGKYNTEKIVVADAATIHNKSPEAEENALLLVALCKVFGVQLREIINYVRQIKAASDFIDGEVHFFCLAILIFSRARGSSFYREVLTQECGTVLRKFCPAGSALKLHMGTELVVVNDVISYHILMMLGAEMKFDDTGPAWKEVVYKNYKVKPSLGRYKPVVDLAHQLS
ncbi:TPA: P-loop NTPase fold protein [Pseudomonas putida]